MIKANFLRYGLIAVISIAIGCSSTSQIHPKIPKTDDLLELLTGFGESLSKKNFTLAAEYLTPEDRNLLMDSEGNVPEDKQKLLLALPLQKLIRHPSVHVENGHIAGIYALLPNTKSTGTSDAAAAPTEDYSGISEAAVTPTPEVAAETSEETPQEGNNIGSNAELQAATKKFFSALQKKSWTSALALLNEDERKFLTDDKGRIKESSKQRLSQLDPKKSEGLTLQDGKITGITLLLPAD